MKLIVKIEEEDVGTFLLGQCVGIKTQMVDVLFSHEAMEKLVLNYTNIVKGKKMEPIKQMS